MNASPGALALAVVVGGGLGIAAMAVRRRRAPSPGSADRPVRAPDLAFLLSLVRRAHGARAVWVVGLPDGDAYVDDDQRPVEAVYVRGLALARLAAQDGRTHSVPDEAGVLVAVGSFPVGAATLLASAGPDGMAAEGAAADLRRVVLGLSPSEQQESKGATATRLAELAATAPSVEGIAHTAAEMASRDAGGPAAIIARTVAHPGGEIVAVSRGADRRLLGRPLPTDTHAARCIDDGVPVVAGKGEDVLSHGLADRRQRVRALAAVPVLDGRNPVGAVVLFGEEAASGEGGGGGGGPGRSDRIEAVLHLAADLAPRLAAALALRDAEARAVTDVLTGLPNRRALEQELARPRAMGQSVVLLYADIDHFKEINDRLGHPAGDAALRHLTRVFQGAVRDVDLVARIGGEEFAVWLPGASLERGREIAERMRSAVESTEWLWLGTRRPLTCSIGLAAFPAPVKDVANLPSVADAALYRAKQGGRNRVESGMATG